MNQLYTARAKNTTRFYEYLKNKDKKLVQIKNGGATT